MTGNTPGVIWRTAYLLLGIAAFVVLLFIMNLRSRIYYHGPDYSFLFWIFLYCALTGIGLLRLRKWALISLYLPGVLMLLILIYSTSKRRILVPWDLINVIVVALLLGIPTFLFRYWKTFNWRL